MPSQKGSFETLENGCLRRREAHHTACRGERCQDLGPLIQS